VSLDAIAQEELKTIRRQGTHRSLRVLQSTTGPQIQVDDQRAHLFAGSNYLDLAQHPEVVEAASRAAKDWGCASGGSRLINGNLEIHEALEEELAHFLGCESALVFGNGYMANTGLIPALVGEGDLILSDALSHASIIDGCKLSQARVEVFPHGNVLALEKQLKKARRQVRRILLIVDGVYSMEGDCAPLAEIQTLGKSYDAMLFVDDTHGTGSLGPGGRGCPASQGIAPEDIDLHLGSLAKALGSYGAFVGGSRTLRDLLINTCRSFIFSCALPPPQVAAARAALALLQREPWRVEILQANAQALRSELLAVGIGSAPSTTQIVPVIIGANEDTMTVCQDLLARGYFAQGIRFPSVPQGTARLRLTVMATHDKEQIQGLAHALREVLDQRGVTLANPQPEEQTAQGEQL